MNTRVVLYSLLIVVILGGVIGLVTALYSGSSQPTSADHVGGTTYSRAANTPDEALTAARDILVESGKIDELTFAESTMADVRAVFNPEGRIKRAWLADAPDDTLVWIISATGNFTTLNAIAPHSDTYGRATVVIPQGIVGFLAGLVNDDVAVDIATFGLVRNVPLPDRDIPVRLDK